MAKDLPAAVVYRDALFRDCVQAIMTKGGWTDLQTLELDNLNPDSIRDAETVVVEADHADADWWRTLEPVLHHPDAPKRRLVVRVSFSDEGAHLLVSRKLAGAEPARLLDLLEAWTRDPS